VVRLFINNNLFVENLNLMGKKSYNKSVFINCPIDSKYKSLFFASVFTVIRCGFYPRCAEEESDSCEIRLTKIYRMISECKYGIHDLSMTSIDRKTRFPRFNMPFELGIFLAAKYFGDNDQIRKNCLIFEKQSHSYEKYISDIKGQDISSHTNNSQIIIGKIRDWLNTNSKSYHLPGGMALWTEYQQFQKWLPSTCRSLNLEISDLTYHDYAQLVYSWIEKYHPNIQ
jgi:hypothetical protein